MIRRQPIGVICADSVALQVLPDIRRYECTVPAAYRNGRCLIGAMYNVRYAWLSNGKIPRSGLKPRGDLIGRP